VRRPTVANIRHLLQAIGVPLLAAVLVLAASLWSFGAITEELLEGDTFYDERLAEWLHGRATEPLTGVFRAVTVLGNFVTLLALALVAVAAFWRSGERTDAVFVAFAFLGAQVLSAGLKLGFRRDRPFFADPLATESTYSFPSGHALVSLSVYGSVALVLAGRIEGRGRKALLLASAGSLVAAIGFSRLYLGVHFLSDVVAGFAAGTAWLAILYLTLALRSRYVSRPRASGCD
jgi:undecaprenyl-diphosphatase